MLNVRPTARPARRPLAGALVLVLTLAACGAASTPSPTPPAGGASPTPRPTPTAVPGASGGTGIGDPGSGNGAGGGSGSGGSTGGGTDPGTGNGIIDPGNILFPPGPVDDPMLGDAKYVQPADGLVNQRNANVQLVRAAVGPDGRAVADLRWYSGVEPCNMLDEVRIERDDAAKTIHLVVIEGSGPGDAMCIEIAELHAAAVDLGALPPGTWVISAEGDAPEIKLDVP